MLTVTIDDIREIVDTRSGGKAKLISDSYSIPNETLTIQCQCGNIFTRKYASLRRSKILCPECAKKRNTYERNTIDKIMEEIELAGCTYISGDYINAKSKLTYQCKCGRIFVKRWGKFHEGQNHCPQCGIDQRRKFTTDSAKELFKQYGYALIDEYKNTYDKLKCLDSDNQICYISITSLLCEPKRKKKVKDITLKKEEAICKPTVSLEKYEASKANFARKEKAYSKKIEKLEEKNQKLANSLQKSESSNETMKDKINALNDSNKGLKSEINVLQTNVRTLTSEIIELKNCIETLKNEMRSMVIDMDEVNTDVVNAISEVYESKKEVALLCKELKDSRKQVEKETLKNLRKLDKPQKEVCERKPKIRNPLRHSELCEIVRDRLESWKRSVRKKYNNTCPLSGETDANTVVHHLLSLNLIFDQVISNYPLDCTLSSIVCNSEKDKFESLITAVVQKHSLDMGIVLSKDIHEAYHKEYTYGNNTPEQFNEFLIKHYNTTLYDLQNAITV